jgi:hypothetical protein
MKKTLLILVMLFPLSGFSQVKLSGRVYNAQTREILPYANVIIESRNTGTISDKDGLFELTVNPSDTVTVSYIGFQTTTLIAEESATNNDVYLEPVPYEISDVIVTNRKSKLKKLGHSSGGSNIIGLAIPFFQYDEIKRGDRIGKEVGVIIKIKSDTSIKSFNVFITKNLYELAKFRLTFYSVQDGIPGDVLINRDITFEITSQQKGRYTLDLTPYDIFLDSGQEVLVTMTLLDETGDEIPNVFWLNGALAGKGVFKRNVGMSEWNRIGGTITMYLEGRVYSD